MRNTQSYEDLNTSLGLARFYGDHIQFTDTHPQRVIKKEDIKKVQILFFKVRIFLENPRLVVRVGFNSKLFQWLEPHYFAHLFVKMSVFTAAFLLSFFRLNFQYFWICLLYAAANYLLVSFFFSILKQPLQRSFFFVSSLYAALNIPLLLYLPLSSFFWLVFVSVYAVYLTVSFLISKNTLPGRIFLACLWILLSVSTYNWFVTILKVSFDAKLRHVLKQNGNFVVHKNHIAWGSIVWKKPVLWSWEEFSFWQKYTLGREIIFQVQPMSPVVLLHLPDQRKVGWLTLSALPPAKIFSFISFYFSNQRHLIWAKLLNHDALRTLEPSAPPPGGAHDNKLSIHTQRYLFFDFTSQKEIILHFVAASIEKEGKYKSFLWCIKQDTEKSIDYTIQQLIRGMSKI